MIDDGDGDGGAPADDRGTYQVGYGKPPKSGQIKPGEVRNPRGKARGVRSLKTDVREMLAMPVPMTKGGKVVHVTTRAALVAKLREKALKGDARSLDRLLSLAMQFDDPDGVAGTTSSLMTEDEAILANARERERQARAEAEGTPEPAAPGADDETKRMSNERPL